MKASLHIAALYPGLVRLVAAVVSKPGTWFTVPELMQAGQVSRATVYRRGANLVAARVFQRRRRADQVEFCAHPRWSEAALGQALAARFNPPN